MKDRLAGFTYEDMMLYNAYYYTVDSMKVTIDAQEEERFLFNLDSHYKQRIERVLSVSPLFIPNNQN